MTGCASLALRRGCTTAIRMTWRTLPARRAAPTVALWALRSGIDGETPMQVSLRNESGQVSALMALPPLGAAAEIRDASGVLFAGSVHDVDVSAPNAQVGIETLLAGPLPLRQSTIWGGYREAVPLPHRYGSVSGALIQYNATRTLFAWADHACVWGYRCRAGGGPTCRRVAVVHTGGCQQRADYRCRVRPATG